MGAKEPGVIYFKLADRYDSGNTTYGNDTTKNCGLSGAEIDKNFHFLRGSDIESGMWSPETKTLVLKRVNGEMIQINGTDFSQVISFSGSTFTQEDGGTLTLVANGGEPYKITGFTSLCEEILEDISGLTEDEELLASLNEDVIQLSANLNDFINDVYLINDEAIKEELIRINEEFASELCDIKERLENEIIERIKNDKEINGRFEELKQEYTQAFRNFTIAYTEVIDGFDRRITNLAKKVEKQTYYDDRSVPHASCDEVKWGVIIQNYEDIDGQIRKKIVLNLDPNDRFLSQNCDYLSSTITLKYDKENNLIQLRGNNDQVVSSIDASIFIQKGFLDKVECDGTYLILYWNGAEPTYLPLTELFTPYTQGNGIEVNANNVISVAIEGNPYINFRYGRLSTGGLAQAFQTVNNQIYEINGEIIEINHAIEHISEYSDEIRELFERVEALEHAVIDVNLFSSDDTIRIQNTQNGTNITIKQIKNPEKELF